MLNVNDGSHSGGVTYWIYDNLSDNRQFRLVWLSHYRIKLKPYLILKLKSYQNKPS